VIANNPPRCRGGARLEPMRRAMDGILALSDAHSVAAALREARSA
jgi:hypothetical protein